jgi:hypothetical protein
MPRRSAIQILSTQTSVEDGSHVSENLSILRRQWKWAAFCQFFHTFAPLFNMADVSIPVSALIEPLQLSTD